MARSIRRGAWGRGAAAQDAQQLPEALDGGLGRDGELPVQECAGLGAVGGHAGGGVRAAGQPSGDDVGDDLVGSRGIHCGAALHGPADACRPNVRECTHFLRHGGVLHAPTCSSMRSSGRSEPAARSPSRTWGTSTSPSDSVRKSWTSMRRSPGCMWAVRVIRASLSWVVRRVTVRRTAWWVRSRRTCASRASTCAAATSARPSLRSRAARISPSPMPRSRRVRAGCTGLRRRRHNGGSRRRSGRPVPRRPHPTSA